MLRRVSHLLLTLSVATGYRLLFDSPGRANLEPDLPPDLPPPAEEEDRGLADLPGFITKLGNCVQPPPKCPNENITFWFYTRKTQYYPMELDLMRPETLTNIQVDRGKPWKLIIHGYTGNKDYDPNPQIRKALFENGKYNVISIDYGPIVKNPCYFSAAANVPLVANCTAQLLDTMIQMGTIPLKDFHVISFSLGTHVSGNIRNFLKAGVIPRISALDPAFPLFFFKPDSDKLDKTDAAFVDVIHTNAGQRGMPVSVGDVDFYPNGGYSQFGCVSDDPQYGSKSSCNHARAVQFYAESINSETGFWAVPCNSIVTYTWGWCEANETNQIPMGYYVPKTARGNYYLSTNDAPPYAMGRMTTAEKRTIIKLKHYSKSPYHLKRPLGNVKRTARRLN